MDVCLWGRVSVGGCKWMRVRVRISVFTWQSLLFYCDLLANRERERKRDRKWERSNNNAHTKNNGKKFPLGKTCEQLQLQCGRVDADAGAVCGCAGLPHRDNKRSLPNCCAAQKCGMCVWVCVCGAKQKAIDKCNTSQENENLLSAKWRKASSVS